MREAQSHDFEIAFDGANLNECIVLPDIAKPSQPHDLLLATFLLQTGVDVPMCFAMRDMNFMIRRPRDAEDAAQVREHNAKVRLNFTEVVATRLTALARNFGNSTQ